MRASLRCWLGAAPLAATLIALPMLLVGPGARSVPAWLAPDCGVAAWTGTCVCQLGPRRAPASFESFAASARAAGQPDALAQARRQCGMQAAG